jgi:hypothetical protein
LRPQFFLGLGIMERVEYWNVDFERSLSFTKFPVKLAFANPSPCSGQVHKVKENKITHHSITPSFPGPDLACRAGVAQTLLRKYYGENKIFQATRARAGQYFNCETKWS